VSIFGPLFQAHGLPMLEAACHNIATWYDCTSTSVIVLLTALRTKGTTPLQERRLNWAFWALCSILSFPVPSTSSSSLQHHLSRKNMTRNLMFVSRTCRCIVLLSCSSFPDLGISATSFTPAHPPFRSLPFTAMVHMGMSSLVRTYLSIRFVTCTD
jgi:hypothetical protein